MKKTRVIALCGTISALALAIMLAAYFPYMTYALPALAGALFSIILIEASPRYAVAAYCTTALLSLLLCEKEASVLFVCFFGYYPIVKAQLERLSKRPLEIILKLLLFNAAVVLAYFVTIYLFRIPMEDMGVLGKYGPPLLLLLGNFVFILYDFALTRLLTGYFCRLHPKIQKLLKNR